MMNFKRLYPWLTAYGGGLARLAIASWLLTILVIYRHRANIVKIKNGTENKISWL